MYLVNGLLHQQPSRPAMGPSLAISRVCWMGWPSEAILTATRQILPSDNWCLALVAGAHTHDQKPSGALTHKSSPPLIHLTGPKTLAVLFALAFECVLIPAIVHWVCRKESSFNSIDYIYRLAFQLWI